MEEFTKILEQTAKAVDEVIESLMALHDDPESRLIEAMRYATLNGGKRIRPFMVMSGAALFNVDERCALRVAAAIEMVHSYSLVHDDLPAMDDDDLRRGKPTCHIRYGEATAILAGDALLTRAFEVLADDNTHADSTVRINLVAALASSSGVDGMVGGQMLDLMAESQELKMAEITRLQQKKTGALIAFSCEAGAILGKAPKTSRHALHAYAHDLGLAFQIIDDLLDVEGDVLEVGKQTGKDQDAGKETFVSLMGAERARGQADMLSDQAVQHLEMFDEKADPLRRLARFVVERRR